MTRNKGTINVLNHESKVLKDNPLGDPYVRDLPVYLPPDYDDSDTKYPVVFCLAGFTGSGKNMINNQAFKPNVPERLDNLIADKIIEPFIAVMPDCFTYYGGSQYLNSSATGNYEDYLIEELVPFIDENFRTIDNKSSRAVMGKSSGGYGALMMALKHADVFGLACSISGDCYFDLCYRSDFADALRGINGNPLKLVEKMWNEEAKKGKHDFAALNMIGMSACYSPNPDSADGFDLPFDLETAEIREDIWAKWLKHDPVNLVEKYAENLKSLELLFIDAGTKDEFALDLGAKILSKKLKEHDIKHIHEEFDDGHFNINYRENRSFELISKSINFE